MTDHERGAYTPPTDGPLAFDPRQPVRGSRPAPVALVLSILVLAGLIGALFVFYRSGANKGSEAPETVGAPVAAMTSPATPETQPPDPAAGLQIYRAETGAPMETTTPPPKFAPPPEEPAPRAAPTPPVQVAQAPPVAPAAAPAIRPAIPAAPPAPKAVAAAPAPAKAPVPVKAPTPAAPKPVAVAEAKPKPAPAPAASPTGGAVVQIGALGSKALAEKAWSDAVAAAPGAGAGKGRSITPIDKDGTTLYRTAVTGFASKTDAQAFCAKLKATGKSCFVR